MGRFVVKYKHLILTLAFALLIPSVIGMLLTRVNYDMLSYLPENMDTVVGQKEFLEDFGKGAFSMIVTEDLPTSEQAKLEDKIRKVEHVDTVLGLGTIEEANFPPEMIPDSMYNTLKKGDESLIAVFFDTSTSAEGTLNAVSEIRKLMDSHIYVAGMSAFILDLKEVSNNEQILYVVIAVGLALLVMFLMLDNWLAPIIFLVSIGAMILINMGTNVIFGEISYITKALSAVLQLAVTMDYSIFLWHSYREYLKQEDGSEEAMVAAIKATLSSVFGSSATTVAGFIALCFMSFTMGVDLGLAMAKGVILGVIGSVTVLPALVLTFDKLLLKLDHKTILPKFEKTAGFIVKYFMAFLIVFVAIIPPALYGYNQTNSHVSYELSNGLPADTPSAVANNKLSETFGLSNMHMILTSATLDEKPAREMATKLKEVDGVKSVLSLESLVPENVPLEMMPREVNKVFKSNKWELSLVVSEYRTATEEMTKQIDEISGIIKSYDESALLIGEASCTQDMIKVTSTDFQVVNTISIIAIFIIIAIVTRSATLPFILITVIEIAIFINLAISYYTGTTLSFIAPICISTIQLGATVDYAILMTTRYKRERIEGKDRREAAKLSLTTSIPSIVVSGSVLFAATIGVAILSRADMISSLCMLLARGAVISIVVVPGFLPPLLMLADPIIIRTTVGMKKIMKGKE